MAETSMLQVIFDGMERTGRSMQPLVRICLIGRPANLNQQSFHTWQKWCAEQLKDFSEDKLITGLLLSLPTGWIMLLEGIQVAVTDLVRRVSAQQGRQFEVAKVIYQSEDVPMRAFSAWGSKSAKASRKDHNDIGDGKLSGMLGELVIGMLQIGQGVGGMSARDLEKIDNWERQFPHMPSNERIEQVMTIVA